MEWPEYQTSSIGSEQSTYKGKQLDIPGQIVCSNESLSEIESDTTTTWDKGKQIFLQFWMHIYMCSWQIQNKKRLNMAGAEVWIHFQSAFCKSFFDRINNFQMFHMPSSFSSCFWISPLCSLHNVSDSEMFLTLLECTVVLRSSYRFSIIFQSGAWEVHSKTLISCISWFIWKHISYHYFTKLSKLSSALISSVNMEHQLVRYCILIFSWTYFLGCGQTVQFFVCFITP